MSFSIFNAALGRALSRRPLSTHALNGFNCALIDPPVRRPLHAVQCCSTTPRAYSDAASAARSSNAEDASTAPVDEEGAAQPRQLRSRTEKRIMRHSSMMKLPHSQKRLYLHTPAPEFLTLLRNCGADIPPYVAGKTNLSYVDPLKSVSERRRETVSERTAEPRRELSTATTGGRVTRYSLKEITALLLYYCNAEKALGDLPSPTQTTPAPISEKLSQILKHICTPTVMNYLDQKKCTPQDLMSWAWVLIEKDGRSSGRRLEAFVKSSKNGNTDEVLIPPFLVLATLQRRHLAQSTLAALLPIVERLFAPDNRLRVQDEKTAIVLAVRLLRRFRESWAEALPRVVDLLVNNFYTVQSEQLPAWVTHTYNRFLTLFSLPTSDGPFKNTPLLQQCQFTLVQKMSSLHAPITREGYRAIISVQVAHHKEFQEAEKVRNMGKNWPPWLVDRDGWVAAHRSAHDEVISRGGQVIRQMMEAGYALIDWEREASVLAGTDTDASPTIQTRTFWSKEQLNLDDASKSLPKKKKEKDKEMGMGKEKKNIAAELIDPADESRRIWAARVRATRTLDEAWSNFQQCRAKRIPHPDVWEEMFEKVIWDETLQNQIRKEEEIRKQAAELGYMTRRDVWLRNLADQKKQSVPGDGKEVIPPPRNPRDGVYNAERAPDVEELFGLMMRDGVKPSNRLAALVLSKVTRPSFALAVLRHWDPKQATLMISPLYGFPAAEKNESPKPVNLKVLAALIAQLCKTGTSYKALQLIRYHRPRYRPAWNTVIESFIDALSPYGSASNHSKINRCENVRAVWRLYREMKELIDIDSETLRLMCIASERWTSMKLGEMALWDGLPPIEQIIPIIFENLGVNGSIEDPAPAPIPLEPAMLHTFVRTLGLSRRYAEIEQLLQFLAQRKMKLEDALERRVLLAARVFLEGAGYGVVEGDKQVVQRGWDTIDRLSPLVNAEWGGWGEERDLEGYLILAGMVRGRRNDVAEEMSKDRKSEEEGGEEEESKREKLKDEEETIEV